MSADLFEKRPCPVTHPDAFKSGVPQEVKQLFLDRARRYSSEGTFYVCPDKLFTMQVGYDGYISRSYYSYLPGAGEKNSGSFPSIAWLSLDPRVTGNFRLGRLAVFAEGYITSGRGRGSQNEEFIDFGYENKKNDDLIDFNVKYLGHRASGTLESYSFHYSKNGLEHIGVGVGLLDSEAEEHLTGEIWSSELASLLKGQPQSHQAAGAMTMGDWSNNEGELILSNGMNGMYPYFLEITKLPKVLDLGDIQATFISPRTLRDPFKAPHEADQSWTQTSLMKRLGIEWELKKIAPRE